MLKDPLQSFFNKEKKKKKSQNKQKRKNKMIFKKVSYVCIRVPLYTWYTLILSKQVQLHL